MNWTLYNSIDPTDIIYAHSWTDACTRAISLGKALAYLHHNKEIAICAHNHKTDQYTCFRFNCPLAFGTVLQLGESL